MEGGGECEVADSATPTQRCDELCVHANSAPRPPPRPRPSTSCRHRICSNSELVERILTIRASHTAQATVQPASGVPSTHTPRIAHHRTMGCGSSTPAGSTAPLKAASTSSEKLPILLAGPKRHLLSFFRFFVTRSSPRSQGRFSVSPDQGVALSDVGAFDDAPERHIPVCRSVCVSLCHAAPSHRVAAHLWCAPCV